MVCIVGYCLPYRDRGQADKGEDRWHQDPQSVLGYQRPGKDGCISPRGHHIIMIVTDVFF